MVWYPHCCLSVPCLHLTENLAAGAETGGEDWQIIGEASEEVSCETWRHRAEDLGIPRWLRGWLRGRGNLQHIPLLIFDTLRTGTSPEGFPGRGYVRG